MNRARPRTVKKVKVKHEPHQGAPAFRAVNKWLHDQVPSNLSYILKLPLQSKGNHFSILLTIKCNLRFLA